MNRKFILNLLSSPVLFASMLSMVMIARPAHANQMVTPIGTHLSCVRSPHLATARQVCIQVSNTPATTTLAKAQPTEQTEGIEFAANIPEQQVQGQKVQPNQIAELEFTDQESDEAIQLFGCDCPVCLNAVRQLHGLAPLPV
jgi:hypothetical protein